MANHNETKATRTRTVTDNALMAAGALFLLALAGGFLYGAWNYQLWQYEWATGCHPAHGELTKAEWFIGLRPFEDCRPWWARRIFD
jgi:hypothetical protein